MARAYFVKKARKDVPNSDIKKGESYWWWKFKTGGRGGARHVSRTEPKPSQLTQSEFWSQMYAIKERMEDIEAESIDDLEAEVNIIAEDIRQLGEECQEKLGNMPEGLQQGSSGETLQERIDACEEMASELESIDFSFDEPEKEEDESDDDFRERKKDELNNRIQEILSDVQAVDCSCS